MNKRIFLTMLLLTSLIGSSVLNVSAAKTKAIWCKDIKTLYFLYDDKEYVAGGKYGENTITQVCNVYGSWPYHNKVEDILNNCTTVVIEDNFKDSGLNTCYGMFHSFKALTSVQGLKNMITTSTKDLGTMFFNCSSLTTIDFSGVNTSNVTNMSDMFQGCSALSTLDLSNFDTKKVQYMQDMFKDCQSLATLTLGEFNTSKVENMSYMFYGCQTLTTLDLRCFDTSLVTNMYNMFFNCNHLTSLDVTSFNTSRVTNMSYMFGFCKALASLNLYSFDVSEVTNMTYMFYDATELVTIVAEENWEEVGSKISSSSDMFTNCNKLKGNINYSSSNTTVHYANLNGYFTKRPEVDMSFSPSTAQTATVGTAFTPPTLTTNPVVDVTYTSSNTAVAAVNETTGAVTPLLSGTTTITASYAGNAYYYPSSKTYELTVNAKQFPASIGGVTLTSDHIKIADKLATDIGTKLTKGSVSLTANDDFSGLTLTLTDAKIEMYEESSPFINNGTLALVLVGNNVIYSKAAPLKNLGTLSISGTGRLTMGGYAYSIENEGSITLNGGTLDLNGMDIGYYGSKATSSLVINDGVLATSGNVASIRIIKDGNMTLGTDVSITQPVGAHWDKSGDSFWDVCDGSGNTIKSQVIIAKGAVPCDLAYSAATATAIYNTPTTLPTLSNPYNLPVTYGSSNYNVATIDSKGVVKILRPSADPINIVATFAGNTIFKAGSASYQLTVEKGTPILSYSATTASAVYNESFTEPLLLVLDGLSGIEYSSSDPSVATIVDNKVVIQGKGTTDITASFPGNDYYKPGETKYKLTVSPADATLAFEKSSLEGKVGKALNSPAVTTTPASLTVKYSSSDVTKATVDATKGVVTPLKEGTVNITATVDDGHYYGTTSYQLTITKNEHGLAFAQATATATYSEAFTGPALTNPNSLTVTYESSEPTVATVASDGKVTVLKAGKTTISAKFAGNDTYKAGSVNYVLTVAAKTVSSPTITLGQTFYFYDGTAKKPTVTVKDGSTPIPDSEYTISYSNNTAVGTATVTITDVAGGNYTVSGSATFEIGLKGDANGDKKVDAADIVKLVNDHAPQAEIDEVVKIIMGK